MTQQHKAEEMSWEKANVFIIIAGSAKIGLGTEIGASDIKGETHYAISSETCRNGTVGETCEIFRNWLQDHDRSKV